ncbi:hypothetical protein DJ46_5729 (plasmid) [Bacillus anthracis str. Vollum]|nr:hypothetical protein BX_A0098 [Bacillus anthracis str. A2012]ACP17768.1 conserved hypothetical protein [Bacillus anthracis str. CDC 684]AFH86955.1 Hypothetical Protein H9401_5570 [Bacillus anthracis str. H9401]AHK41714.1 hypothetical protein BAPAT_pXO10094 [Bacillus anthracis str. SVA11]AIK55232.1 hypothetical protein DJ44_5654 [Bacillus anthracis]AIK61003.1 hypothetical protein DJ46_5729 [Bacillus anthracis str. Vollum]AJG51006.1 hypothetical protein AS53_5713 [Bacillus anthracis str. Tur
MKMNYEVSIFCSAHPADFMPNLRALRMKVTKEGAFWERDCYQFSIKPSNLSQRAAKQAGEIYLYHVYFNGCIRDFLFLLERCFRGTSYRFTAIRGFLEIEGYSLKKWKPILRSHHINSTDVDSIFKKNDLTMIVHHHGALEVAKHAEKGEQLKK